jgi:predicted MPP superfamily phosphohydrolase
MTAEFTTHYSATGRRFFVFGVFVRTRLYHEGNTWLYVNRGIGMEGGQAPRVRFWSRPELTVIDIRSATP